MNHDTPDNAASRGEDSQADGGTSRTRSQLVMAYHDGELSPSGRDAVEVMLATDPAMQAELEALRSLSNRLVSLGSEERGDFNLNSDVLAAVRAEIDQAEDQSVLLRISGWAAGLAAMVLIGCSLLLGAGANQASAASSLDNPFGDASALLQLQATSQAGEAELPVEAHLSQMITSELLAADLRPSSEGL